MARRTSIGPLDQRVTFQEERLKDDGQGGRTSEGWRDIARSPKMWANIDQQPGREGDGRERRTQNTYTVRVLVRNRSDLLETMRLVWRGRAYNIRSILPHNFRREFLEITAEAGAVL